MTIIRSLTASVLTVTHVLRGAACPGTTTRSEATCRGGC